MRYLMGVMLAGLAAVVLGAGSTAAGEVVVKGPHICCKRCISVVGKILEKVDGVSEAKCDVTAKTVTFTAKDSAAAKAGFKALVDGGFYGAATEDGKAIQLGAGGVKKGDIVDAVTVKGVHVCCGMCKSAIKGLFKDTTISYEGAGPQLTVVITGSNLERSAVLQALRKAGFNGTVQK